MYVAAARYFGCRGTPQASRRRGAEFRGKNAEDLSLENVIAWNSRRHDVICNSVYINVCEVACVSMYLYVVYMWRAVYNIYIHILYIIMRDR